MRSPGGLARLAIRYAEALSDFRLRRLSGEKVQHCLQAREVARVLRAI